MPRKIFLFVVAILFLYIASPLIAPVAMGAVVAVLFYPLLKTLERRKISPVVGSGILTLVITCFLLLPASVLIFVGTREAFHQIQALRIRQMARPLDVDSGWVDTLISTPRIHSLLEKLTEWIPITLQQLTETTQELTRTMAAKLADVLGQIVTLLPGMVIAMAVIVVSVYFFLIDGQRIVGFFKRNSVFAPQQTDRLLAVLAGTCRSVILASVISGAAQASAELIFCLSTGVDNAALIAVLVFLASFVPVIGSTPITVGVALHQFFLGRNNVGLVLLGAALLVILLDNFIRPFFLKGSANLHPLLAFVAALGGLQTIGFSGVFLGPIIGALCVATMQVMSQEISAGAPSAPLKQ